MVKSVVTCFSLLLFMACNTTKKMDTTAAQSTESLTETYWKLTELNGLALPALKEGENETFLRLRTDSLRVEGNGGCNGFGGTYELKDGNRIRFSNMISTMMYCSRMEIENALLKVLGGTDNYVIVGNVLQLNKARMSPLAKFVAVSNK